ncbi:SRPBCC family protein [Phytoactinopolyspora mesophila]|uniref:Polyketide cyclase n=1 Tax=Phytoactinopolyspora mesophila TaxID=2650750 RepID=A0A7K3M9V0_9ACTN|nr:SRPBCC family protein [Phytoactinopolyspora mesophila]NDL60063.1 polyketide cyclase [Phytoactinopolyspora mesophila]
MIDVTQQINDVRREIGTRVIEAGEARTVTISQTYDAAVDDLWDACTNPERLPRWFLPVSGDLRLNGTYQLEGNAGGTIEQCDPPHSFAATWEYGGAVSWIEVRFVPESAGRTRLELEHIAMEDEHWAEFGPGAAGIGWDLAFIGLALHVDTGDVVDHAAVEAWGASDDGRQFVLMSSERWREADVAAGTDEGTARQRAGRTAAFFTGASVDESSG